MKHLKQNYDHIIVGKSYLSLISAISLVKSGKSVLVINDQRLKVGKDWLYEIGLVEKIYLEKLINSNHIVLPDTLDSYLSHRETILYLNDNMIQLGPSPYTNIREMSRKLPECFGSKFVSQLDKIEPQKIDSYCDKFANDLAQKTFDEMTFDDFQLGILESKLSGDLKNLYDLFMMSLVESTSSETRQLHFSLQVIFQTMFTNVKKPLEIYYLLTSMLNPRFSVNSGSLESSLLDVFLAEGGDYKEAQITDWQFYKNKLNGIVLDSYEGYIKTQSLKLHSDASWFHPFESKSENPSYKCLNISAIVDHDFVDFYIGKRILFTNGRHIGTDYPHIQLVINENKQMLAKFVFPNVDGAKASFHKQAAFEQVYACLNKLLPGLDYSNWLGTTHYCEGDDVWVEYRQMESNNAFLSTKAMQKRDVLYSKETGSAIKGVTYWGPVRCKDLGTFAYLLDLHDDLASI